MPSLNPSKTVKAKYFPSFYGIIRVRIDKEVMSLVERRYPKRFPRIYWENLWEGLKNE